MPTIWLFNAHHDSRIKPAIGGQLKKISNHVLSLHNPWAIDSVFMGKIYTAMIATMAALTYPELITLQAPFNGDYEGLVIRLLLPLTFAPFLIYRIYFIKNLSSIYFNRLTKKIYCQHSDKLLTLDWPTMAGGLFSRTEFGGASFSTSHALALAPYRADGTLHLKDGFWIDSNEPTDASVKHVAEVWEYLRHFMDHGPDKLPPPGEPNWWHKPWHAICLPPAEAWRHYAPWRTGEPGEMQGKKNWQLPFWAVLFPYNLTVALCWYVICRTFNVRAAPPPPEAFEEAPMPAKKRKRR
ncbi:DUF6708 domain-containing protein [Pseudomonas sp. PSKL.D1]|uniref:DUF6708 domain-containing protein n=1 Tax=Pseudomonas sp. PSKL.D1 TaxID=3029060 RepID=UPI0023814F76|nr:DUF6708 domain-containing protein [Pseudomonas sp. PSKL.D1]WDY60028.1 hypothetical protein PVV54_10535 [Pseudomonas sp. PSKL.D1]